MTFKVLVSFSLLRVAALASLVFFMATARSILGAVTKRNLFSPEAQTFHLLERSDVGRHDDAINQQLVPSDQVVVRPCVYVTSCLVIQSKAAVNVNRQACFDRQGQRAVSAEHSPVGLEWKINRLLFVSWIVGGCWCFSNVLCCSGLCFFVCIFTVSTMMRPNIRFASSSMTLQAFDVSASTRRRRSS